MNHERDTALSSSELAALGRAGRGVFRYNLSRGQYSRSGMLDIVQHRDALQSRRKPKEVDDHEWERILWKQLFVRVDHWLDAGSGGRCLVRDELAREVANALLHFAGTRCDVFAFAVMPSHFHWLFRPRPEWVESIPVYSPPRSPRQLLVQSVNRFSAGKCNTILGRTGQSLWQDEAYDHWVRRDDELERIIAYIENNPVKAGLAKKPVDWLYSSARLRWELNLRPGEPIPKYTFATRT